MYRHIQTTSPPKSSSQGPCHPGFVFSLSLCRFEAVFLLTNLQVPGEQMEPSSSLPSSFPATQEEEGQSKGEVLLSAGQGWLKYGQCPKGTIPIIRTHKRLGGEADEVNLQQDLRPIYKQQWL